MPPLESVPEVLFLVRLGESLFYEAVVGDDFGELNVFLTREQADAYLTMVEPFSSSLEVRQMATPRVWMRLPELNRECLKSFGCRVKLVVCGIDQGQVVPIEVLWDPEATQH